ncbi:hypothetical protein N9Z02_00790 [Akkermansiaceae bacterium]|nr:hypothetical protein [Akkermansiaceae bacterium]
MGLTEREKLGRRDKPDEELAGLMEAIARIEAHAKARDIDLLEVIEVKINFNKDRPDHKPENRKKPGGKKF